VPGRRVRVLVYGLLGHLVVVPGTAAAFPPMGIVVVLLATRTIIDVEFIVIREGALGGSRRLFVSHGGRAGAIL
jgi:hypothetical protein